MNNIFKNLIFECWLILNLAYHPIVNAFNCPLPEKCRIDYVYNSEDFYYFNQKEFQAYPEIICDINEKFEFTFKDPTTFNNSDEKCFIEYPKKTNIIFKWSSQNELSALEERFNFTNLMRYLSFFDPIVYINFWGINGFDVRFLGENFNISEKSLYIIVLSDCRLNFYHNRKRINSCQDFIDLNITKIASIFQISFDNLNDNTKGIQLRNIEYKGNICPFVFQNANFLHVLFNDLVDSFYKKNVLTFSNETYPQLNSVIRSVQIHNVYNINIDLKLLHQSVFNKLASLLIASGSLRSISGEIFKSKKYLFLLLIHPMILRKINHKQGIEWIRDMNFDLNINFSREPSKEEYKHFNRLKVIILTRKINNPHTPITMLLPDEDFCIYVHFPFNQLVIVNEYYSDGTIGTRNFNSELSCTYLWLVQYYEYYIEYLKLNENSIRYMEKVLNSTAFKSISRCDFEKRIKSCNKSNYHRKDIWDENDFYILNKKIQIAFKISLYPISLFGLITNFIVVLVILKKENSDLFKEFKQYNYLYLNSIFCMLISLIELLSWMTECFYPFEVFCPEIRKLIGIQFFKIIFRECFVTLFRFMCNFTYIAFALNRISLIGKDHGKLVTFMSEVGIKKYIGVTFLISLLLSWMKYFQYEVNYFYPNLDFPMFNQVSMAYIKSNTLKDVFFILNVISDLVNYFVFVVICVVIDICMVVQLRRILNEKLNKSQSMNQKQNESKTTECEEAVNKAIKMVVLNSAIGIFFKFPVCFIPLLNVYADDKNIDHNLNFSEFFHYLLDSEFYSLIQDMSYFLFTLSLSIQMFIYYRFDKKMMTGYQRIMDKTLKSIFRS